MPGLAEPHDQLVGQRMKAEYSLCTQYAAELFRENILSEDDYVRVTNSLQEKGVGFVQDMTSLASDIRLGLSTGCFRLGEHCNKVFHRHRKELLPVFLRGALSRVFCRRSGVLLDTADYSILRHVLMFLDSLKRTDPPSSHVSALEEKVWSNLRDNFSDEGPVFRKLQRRIESDPQFRGVMFRLRDRFRSIINVPMPWEQPELYKLGYGPGKNLDRYDAYTSMDWYVSDPPSYWRYWDRLPRAVEYLDSVVRSQLSYSPMGTSTDGKHPVTIGTPRMKCSAQPKSFKAFRGVGVTYAYRVCLQIACQRAFYGHALNRNLPLKNSDEMSENLRNNWSDVGTIDLSAASDRTYWGLLSLLGKGVPYFEMVRDLRVQNLELPDGTVPCASPVMGEPITFPLISAFFAAVALTVCDNMGSGHDKVRVYGDDIQTVWYYETLELLEALGAKPSREKSYPPDSPFKESCEFHAVGERELYQARPCFIPSFAFTKRGRLSHADRFKLLILAKESFMRNGILAKAICDFIEARSSIHLPLVPYDSPFLGRPTLRRSEPSHLRPVLADDSEQVLSERAFLRTLLRGSEEPTDYKLYSKLVYRAMSKKVSRLVVHSELDNLAQDIVISCLSLRYPEEYHRLMSEGKSRLDLYSYTLSKCTDEELTSYIRSCREKLQLRKS